MNTRNIFYLLLIFMNTIICPNLMATDENVSYSIALTEPNKSARLQVIVSVGSISISGYKGKTIEVSATANKLKKNRLNKGHYHERVGSQYFRNSNFRTKRRPSAFKEQEETPLQLNIEEYKNEVTIESISRNQDITLNIKVPYKTNLEAVLRRSNNEINVKNVQGAINLVNIRGSISATGIHGPIIAETFQKELMVTFDDFNVEKSSSLNTNRGNIDVTLPKESKVVIKVKSFQGGIYSDINEELLNKNREENNHLDQKKIVLGDTMTAQLNNGTQVLMLNALNGNVYIREN